MGIRPVLLLTDMPLTPAERQRRWRQRLAGQLPPAPDLRCVRCSFQHLGAHGDLCAQCWWGGEGREQRNRRRREQRAAARAARAITPPAQ